LGDHSGHTIVIQQGANGICDCGNIDAMLPCGFCPKHQNVGLDPDLSILDSETRGRFVPVFSTVVSFILEQFPSDSSLQALEWLVSFAEWGTAYRRLIVNSICDGPLVSLFESSLEKAPETIPFLTEFTVALVTDVKIKPVLADYFFVLIERVTAHVIAGIPEEDLGIYRSYFSWTVQIFGVASTIPFRRRLHSFVNDIIKLSGYAIRGDSVLIFTMFPDLITPFINIFSRPDSAREIIYRDQSGLAELIRLIAALQGIGMSHRGANDSPVDTLIGTQILLNFMNQFLKVIQYGFKLVNADVPKIEKNITVYERLPDPEKLEEVLGILIQLKNQVVEWNQTHPISNPNVLSGEWTLLVGLNDVFFRFVSTAMRFLKIPMGVLEERLKLAGNLAIVERSVMAIAVLEYFGTPAFAKCNQLAIRLATNLHGPTTKFSLFSELFSHCTCYLAMEDNPVAFVSFAIEVFGVKDWLESGGKALTEEVEPWLPVCLLCRFFVILLSDFFQPEGWDISDLIRPSVLHFLGSGSVTAQVAAAKYNEDMELKRIALAALHEFGEPFQLNNARSYKLKPEHENLITPFWIYFRMSDFLQFVSRASETKSPHLLQIPRVNEINGKLTGRFVQTKPFHEFIIQSISIFDAEPNQANIAVYFSLMALIQMVGEITRVLETPSPIEFLVSANIFERLVKMTAIREPLISLMAHAKAAAPSISEHLDSVYSSLQIASPRSIRRVDRTQILARYAAAREQFQRAHIGDELEPEENQEICVSCRAPIDVKSEIWVLGWTGRFPTLCSHFMHFECATRLASPFCPICRRPIWLNTPILIAGYTADQKAAACESLNKLTGEGNFASALVGIGQLLEINPSARIPEGFEKVIQSIIIASSDFSLRVRFPILEFASKLPTATVDEDFDRFLTSVRWNRETPTRIAAILWNCWVSFIGGNLSKKDLSIIPGIPPDLFLLRLPTRYSDLFTNEFYGNQFAAAPPDHHGDFCCCLCCGLLMMITVSLESLIVEHLGSCRRGLLMILTGQSSTLVVSLNIRESRFILHPALYVTEDGDESIGLSLELPLVLSDATWVGL
jgi:hypothetical protein